MKPSLQIRKLKSPTSRTTSSPSLSRKQVIITPLFEDGTNDLILLSPELDAKISKVLGENDSNRLLTIIQNINELFPTEESICRADEVLEKLKNDIKELDVEMRDLIQSAMVDSQTLELVANINSAINDLKARIKVIETKAEQCEKTVVEITRDIKSLDNRKHCLTLSMSLLKRIHLTSNALDYTKGLANRKQFGQLREILKSLLIVSGPLKDFKNNNQIITLCERVNIFLLELKKTLFAEYEGAFHGGTLAMQAPFLNDASHIIELLGDDVKMALCNWYIEMQLTDYRNLFRKNAEVAGLADISRRFAWLKRMLKIYDDNHSVIFPENWRMAELLTWQYCQETKRDLAEVILKSERDGTFDTRVLLSAIQSTIDLEWKLDQRFVNPAGDGEVKALETALKFKKIISSVYDSFLWHYIDMEDQIIGEKMESFKRSLGEVEEGVYGSSLELFLFYRQTFANCAKLSTGKPFLDLCKLYQKWLDKYKELILSKLQRDERRIPNEEDLWTMCTIMNTSDYCGTTAAQLEERLIDSINPEFKLIVSLAAEIDAFTQTTAQTLVALVRAIENTLDNALVAMTKKSWATITSVGDQSEHITLIAKTLQVYIPILRKQITAPKYFRSFCDKFVESFLSKFLNIIYTRCKPLSEVGAEQMLLDTHSLNNILVAMTMIGAEEKSQPPASFTKILSKGVAKIDQLLKVVLRPQDPPAAIVETYLMLFAADHSAGGLQKILELKGIRRIESVAIIDLYNQNAVVVKSAGDKPVVSPSSPAFMPSNKFKFNLNFMKGPAAS